MLGSKIRRDEAAPAGIMTKREILAEFARDSEFSPPDKIRTGLGLRIDRRAFYSYLLRLARQGLLERGGRGRGNLTYRITERGRSRLEYFNRTRRGG